MKLLIEESTLQQIGQAIREKGGANDRILVRDLAARIMDIPSGGGDVEPIVLTDSCNYGCSGLIGGQYLKMYGNTITTKDISYASNMFFKNTCERIPFDINIYSTCSGIDNLFQQCEYLTELPQIIGVDKPVPTSTYSNTMTLHNMFQKCYRLRRIQDDYFYRIVPNQEWWDGSNQYHTSVSLAGMFDGCYSLRRLPNLTMFSDSKHSAYYSALYYNFATYCASLDTMTDLPVMGVYSSNAFSSTFYYLMRVKDIMFQLDDNGAARVASWKNQTLDLSSSVGWIYGRYDKRYVTDYNSGITADKEVTDDASYQALKDDPDWFTADINYSRYNHDSAVNTINSLPDCSATGTNTIKFKGAAGALTDGGAINTLTEAEIAVAAAKGWTVSLV